MSARRTPGRVSEWEDSTGTDSPDDDTFRPPPALDFEGNTGSFSDAPPTERGAAFEDDVTGRLGDLDFANATTTARPPPLTLEARDPPDDNEFVDGTELDLRLWAVEGTPPAPPKQEQRLAPQPQPQPHAQPQLPKKSISTPKATTVAPAHRPSSSAEPQPQPSRWSADRFQVLKRSTHVPRRHPSVRGQRHAPEPTAPPRTRRVLTIVAFVVLSICSVLTGIAAVLYLNRSG